MTKRFPAEMFTKPKRASLEFVRAFDHFDVRLYGDVLDVAWDVAYAAGVASQLAELRAARVVVEAAHDTFVRDVDEATKLNVALAEYEKFGVQSAANPRQTLDLDTKSQEGAND